MGAAGFHGRVRDGIGWDTRAVTTRSAGRRFAASCLLLLGAYRPCGLFEAMAAGFAWGKGAAGEQVGSSLGG